jgi:hypothetical protein
MLDYGVVAKLAEEHKPKLLLSGASAYSRTIDFAKLGEIAASVGAYSMADIAHIAGLVVAGEQDAIFPIGGTREAFATAREIFAAAGCPDNVRLVVGPGGHRFYADLAWPLIREMAG